MTTSYKQLLLSLLLLLSVSSSCYAHTLELDKHFSTSMGVTDLKSGYDAFTDLAENDSPIIQLGSSLLAGGLIIVFGHEVFGHGATCRELDVPNHYGLGHGLAHTTYEHQVDPIKNNYIVIGGLEFQTQLKQRILEDVILKRRVSIAEVVLAHHIEIELLTAFMSFNIETDLQQLTNTLKRWHPDSRITGSTIKHYARFALLDPLPLYNTYFCAVNNNTYYPKEYPRLLPTVDLRLYPEGLTNAYTLYFTLLNKALLKISYENGTTWDHKVQGGSVALSNIHVSNFTFGGELKYVEDCTRSVYMQIAYKSFFVKIKCHNALYSTDTDNISAGINF